ncbi:hypothetical protein [Desulfovibrio sp.]|uniref:hypothetical protein n=1 Tax=Desulfovibrio sp. TaxID=885 RepID=UPI0025BACF6A|nr:hypothetical protein [Desulfovibrio sp.]
MEKQDTNSKKTYYHNLKTNYSEHALQGEYPGTVLPQPDVNNARMQKREMGHRLSSQEEYTPQAHGYGAGGVCPACRTFPPGRKGAEEKGRAATCARRVRFDCYGEGIAGEGSNDTSAITQAFKVTMRRKSRKSTLRGGQIGNSANSTRGRVCTRIGARGGSRAGLRKVTVTKGVDPSQR